MIPRWIESALKRKTITINGNPDITCDFCFVGDVVRANVLAATCVKSASDVFNIASGRSVTLAELIDAIRKAAVALGVPARQPTTSDCFVKPPRLQRRLGEANG